MKSGEPFRGTEFFQDLVLLFHSEIGTFEEIDKKRHT